MYPGVRIRILILALLSLGALCCGGKEERGTSPAPSEAPSAVPPLQVPATPPIVRSVAPPRIDARFAKVHEYQARFERGELAELHALFSDEMKQTLPLEKLRALRAGVAERYGKEIKALGEDTQTRGKYRAFVRWARYDKYDGVIETIFMLRSDDTIAGLFVRPAQPAPRTTTH